VAGKRIRGLTVEIGGDSTDLQKALRAPEKEANSLKSELKEINTALKFDPSNIELLGQKSAVLGKEIAATSEKLKILRTAQEQISQQAERGEIGEEQYRAFQRELAKTESQLNLLKNQLKDNGDQIKQVSENTSEAARSSGKFQQAVEAQRKAVDQAKESSAEHGRSVRNLKDDYREAEKGALSFSDVVKASAIGNLIASGIKAASKALWDFAMTGAAAANEFETNQQKLTHIMENAIGASDRQIESIKQLIEQQEQLGVVSQSAQTAAAQELATYTSRTQSLEKLIPVMNDMIAQQYGVNASQEQAVTVATAVGKTLDGQVGSLSRWGYTFTEAEQRILKSNNELKKMEVIAKVVSGSVGGMSESLRTGTEQGKLFGQSLRIGQIQQEFGRNAEKIKNSILVAILPALTEGLEVINDYIVENGEVLSNLGTILATIINALTNLLKLVTSIPAPLLLMIGGILLAVKAFSSATTGLTALSKATGGMSGMLDPFTIKILALVAALSVLLFLVLSLKEGTDKAASSLSSLGSQTAQITRNAQRAGGSAGGFASGTSSAPRGLAWVGEEGPELVNFRGGERVYTARKSAAMAAAGSTTTSNISSPTYNITVQNVDGINQVVDWYENRRRRERAR